MNIQKKRKKFNEKHSLFKIDDNVYKPDIISNFMSNDHTFLQLIKEEFPEHRVDIVFSNDELEVVMLLSKFGRLLKQIEEKAKDYGMSVKAVDEAYTSKTSCLTANATANQRKRDEGLAITSNDINGYRGGKGNRLGRGLFKDTQLQKVYHSDVGGAANHIKIAFEKKINFDYLRTHLFKLANPIKIKSAAEFDEINRRIGVAG